MRKLFLVILIIILGFLLFSKGETPKSETKTLGPSEYNPSINPADFVSKIDNKFFTLVPGTKFVYENKTEEGLEKIETVVASKTKKIMGVDAVEVLDTSKLNGVLVEQTYDWYAEDKEGNVWYFGEAVDNYKDGKLLDHKGSWEAGVDGALPGIIMKAEPKVGEVYKQEYYKGKAEDVGEVVALDKEVKVPFGSYENCLQTRDYSNIESALNEYKYYCKEVGFVTAEESVSGGSERVQLTRLER
jgi:hypothetical protein